jgi:hypothetical protein
LKRPIFAANIAFVTYATWRAAEAAIAAIDGQKPKGPTHNALVVKFADRPKISSAAENGVGYKRGFEMSTPGVPKRVNVVRLDCFPQATRAASFSILINIFLKDFSLNVFSGLLVNNPEINYIISWHAVLAVL